MKSASINGNICRATHTKGYTANIGYALRGGICGKYGILIIN